MLNVQKWNDGRETQFLEVFEELRKLVDRQLHYTNAREELESKTSEDDIEATMVSETTEVMVVVEAKAIASTTVW